MVVAPTIAFNTDDQDFGIGFDLTPAYGTSAISYGNNSRIALARVEGHDAWRKLMLDLHLRKNRWDDFPAATVPVLTDMLCSLRSATEDILHIKIQNATISLPAIHNTDAEPWQKSLLDFVREAFKAAELHYVQINQFEYSGAPILYPETSVLAGHDIGLCHPYTTTPESCFSSDEGSLADETYYLVGYYANEMEVTTATYGQVVYGAIPYEYVDFELGSDMRRRNPDESYYWDAVRVLLSMPLAKFSWHKPTKVLLYGDKSDDEKLRAAVAEVLATFLKEDEMPEWVKDDVSPEFAGAMGAAEFVLRKPYWDEGHNFAKVSLTVQSPESS